MVAEPAFTAVTTPVEETVATDVLLEDQVTDLSVALAGVTVAVSVSVSPSVKVIEVLFRLTPATPITFAFTVTEHIADIPLSSDVTVMVAEPSATAVTRPFSSTVATAGAEVFQVTVLTDAFDGVMVGVSFCVSPSVNVSVPGMDMNSTATYLPFLPCWETVIVSTFVPAWMERIPSRSYSLFSVTAKVTPHWKLSVHEVMDWTLTQSGKLLTFHFDPLRTVTDLLLAAEENDSSVRSTLSFSGASAS